MCIIITVVVGGDSSFPKPDFKSNLVIGSLCCVRVRVRKKMDVKMQFGLLELFTSMVIQCTSIDPVVPLCMVICPFTLPLGTTFADC